MPSAEVGGDVRRNRALNCWPWVRSLIHSPEAVIHSPTEMVAAWPTTVTTSRCPRALARRVNRRVGTINPPATVRCHPPVPRHGRRVPIGRLCSGCARFLDLVRRFWPYGMRCN